METLCVSILSRISLDCDLNVLPKTLAPRFLFSYHFSASATEVLESLVLRYSQAMLYQFLLESAASEHSARMVAMKSAHDSANDIISDMTLYYNKMRQNSITNELADSVSSRLGQEQ